MAPRLFIVTDPGYDDDTIVRAVELATSAVARGIVGVQLRDKQRDLVARRLLASRLRLVTRARGAWLVVNGDARLAKDVGADGVHLGGGAMSIAEARGICGSQAWVSIAAHTDAAVGGAVRDGANAVLVSPIFPTTSGTASVADGARGDIPSTKRPRGVEALQKARAIVGGARVAIYALGGVSADTARECIRSGADGVAVIRAVLASEDPATEARSFAAAMSAVDSTAP